MTMLDDDRLSSLLARAGAAFDVPASGPDDILARAADGGAMDGAAAPDPAREPRVRRIAAVGRRHRLLSVAASILVVVVLAGAVGALVRGPSQPTATTGLRKTNVVVPSHGPATTIPPGAAKTSAGSSSPSAAAPFGVGAPSAGGGLSSGGAATGGASAGNAPSSSTPPLPSDAVGQSAKIEQTGSLDLTVGRGNLSRTVSRLTNLATAYGGFVANSQTQSGAATGSTSSGSVTLQVPVDSFATVLHRAQAFGKTSDLTTKATDVTGQYVDLQSRITALQASRQQYLTILAKATTVGDVLSVQEQLDAIQSQIEQLQGQLQLLTSQTSFSTLTVTVSERTPAPRPAPVPESGLVRAWHTSIGGFVAGVEGVIRLAGPLLFALLLLGAVLAGGRALWRRYQRHNL